MRRYGTDKSPHHAPPTPHVDATSGEHEGQLSLYFYFSVEYAVQFTFKSKKIFFFCNFNVFVCYFTFNSVILMFSVFNSVILTYSQKFPNRYENSQIGTKMKNSQIGMKILKSVHKKSQIGIEKNSQVGTENSQIGTEKVPNRYTKNSQVSTENKNYQIGMKIPNWV